MADLTDPANRGVQTGSAEIDGEGKARPLGHRKCVVGTAQAWFDVARENQCVFSMENAFNHTENALVVARERITELEAGTEMYLVSGTDKSEGVVFEARGDADFAAGVRSEDGFESAMADRFRCDHFPDGEPLDVVKIRVIRER